MSEQKHFLEELVQSLEEKEQQKKQEQQEKEQQEKQKRFDKFCQEIKSLIDEETRHKLGFKYNSNVCKLLIELPDNLGKIYFEPTNTYNQLGVIKLSWHQYASITFNSDNLIEKIAACYQLAKEYREEQEQKRVAKEKREKEEQELNTQINQEKARLQSILDEWLPKIKAEANKSFDILRQKYQEILDKDWKWPENKTITVYKWHWSTGYEEEEQAMDYQSEYSLTDELINGYFPTLDGRKIKIPHAYCWLESKSYSSVEELPFKEKNRLSEKYSVILFPVAFEIHVSSLYCPFLSIDFCTTSTYLYEKLGLYNIDSDSLILMENMELPEELEEFKIDREIGFSLPDLPLKAIRDALDN